MKHRRAVSILIAAVGISVVSGGWLLQRGSEQAARVYQRARLFEDVLSYIAQFYVDSLTQADLYQMAIDGMLERLGDPYSTFLDTLDLDELSLSTTGKYGGLGIRIDVRDGWITVVAPLPETPAERAGIQPGDRIIHLNGVPTKDWSMEKAVKELRGEPGTVARLTVARLGIPEPIEVSVTRAQIQVRSVSFSMMINERVAYLRLTTVSERSSAELTSAIDSLRRVGMKGLILDLRANPGGLLDVGVDVADLFLDPGQQVVATRGRVRGTSRVYRDRRSQRWPGIPLVILVNRFTASAAEIIAGALQDHDRAVVLGELTFGKGVVQSLFRLGPRQALKLTTSRWYTPSGRSIHRPIEVGEAAVAVAVAGRPTGADTFYTDAGRPVVGGGGIAPDQIITPDTLTTGERAFQRALGRNISVYRDVLTRYALELIDRKVVPVDFQPTPIMRAELLSRLQRRNVAIDEATAARSTDLIDGDLTFEALRYAHGLSVAVRRRLARDPQVQEAIGLLLQAETPSDLFSLMAQRQ